MRAEIVIFCHEADSQYRDALLTQMQPLLEERKLRVWHAGLLRPGRAIETARAAAYQAARVAVVLVSARLLATPGDGGVADARQLGDRGVPLLSLQVSPTASRPFGDLQPLCGGRSLSGLSEHDKDKALAEAALAICDAAGPAVDFDHVYERRYLDAVAEACDQMTLYAAYGLSSEARRHPLTTAYVALDLSADVGEECEVRDVEHPPLGVEVLDLSTDVGEEGEGSSISRTLSMTEVLATLTSQSPAERDSGSRRTKSRRNNLLLIVGEAGRGKTTLLRWIAVQAARAVRAADPAQRPGEERSWDQHVPFFRAVRLAQPSQPVRDVSHLAADFAASLPSRAPDGWEHRVLTTGRGLVLLDGIDEVPPGPGREALLEGIRQLVTNNVATTFVLSSRPAGISGARGMLRALGFREARVQPLAGERLRHFTDHWHQAVAAQAEQNLAGGERTRRLAQITERGAALPGRLAAAPQIRVIAATPLVAALVCAFHLDRGYLPDSRNELMRALVDGMIHRHDAYRDGMLSWPAYESVSEDNKRMLLGLLAVDMVKAREPLVLYDEHGPAGTAALDRHLRPLIARSRKLDDSDLPQLRQGLIQRTGILREPKHGALDFIHLEFRDYLAAQTLIQKAWLEEDFQVIARSLQNPDRHGLFYFAVTAPLALQPEGVADRLAEALLAEIAAVAQPLEGPQGASAKTERAKQRQALRRLAVRLDQSDAPLTRAVRQRFAVLREGLLPPATLEDAESVAELGEDAVAHLGFDAGRPVVVRRACVRALRLIDTDRARASLEGYAAVETAPSVVSELAEAVSPWGIRSIQVWLGEGGPNPEDDRRIWSRLLASAAAREASSTREDAVKVRTKVRRIVLADAEAERCLLRALAGGVQFPGVTVLRAQSLTTRIKVLAKSFPALSSVDLGNTDITDERIHIVNE